jgi:hypothetical protein
MRDSRNPFRLRRSENIDTDTTFITLFEPGILDVLADHGLPRTVQLIRSAAGGGKTSLLRLFTPSVLRRLHARRFDESELFSRLEAIGAIDDTGPSVLGVSLLCGRNYAGLQDMPIEPGQRTRLFLGLLNARIVLAVLRSALTLKGLEYPRDVNRIQIANADADVLPPDLELPCAGQRLYDWSRTVERTICAELDSFGPLKAGTLPGHDALFALKLVTPASLTLDGTAIAERLIIMMDDIHMLTASQRALLVERVIEARSSVGIWIAERFEALSTQELLASGSTEGRDHDTPIELEWYWRQHYERFEKHVMRIADRRVRVSRETELEFFRSCLEDNLDGPEHQPALERAFRTVTERVRARFGEHPQFREWVTLRELAAGSLYEQLVAWRGLEILIERELRKTQKGLFDEIEALNSSELERKDDSSIKQAAELFLAKEFDLPYYFGAARIARLASLNIEQFLGLGGAIFEEVIAGELIQGATQVLSAKRQHALIKKAAAAVWADMPNKVRHGRELRLLLDSVGRFSAWYTYRVTAPNDPGVAGTAIRMSERRMLLDRGSLEKRPERARFADLIASAMAHNYLVADLDYKCKGDVWMVLNLNRLLCVHFDLPLGYGLYKERPLDELCRWVTEPFVVPRTDELVA